MTSLDLLNLVGHTPDSYLQPFPRKKLRRLKPLLLAAALALTAVLVGCTAAYLIRAKDIRLDQQAVTQELHRPDSLLPLETKEVHREIFTLAGWEGTPEYQASREWYDFLQTYDTDNTVRNAFHAAAKIGRAHV